FAQMQLIGVSLGGVAPAIGKMRYVSVIDQESAKLNEGQCTTAEVLAASGIVGFVPYILYMLILGFKPIRRAPAGEIGKLLRGLGWSFVFLMIILQFNQTILRLYLWFHIALLSSAYAISKTTRV